MEDAKVTKHAEKRMKQRLGLNRKASCRHATMVLNKGKKHNEASGRLKRYLDKLFLEYKSSNNTRVYGEYVYLFNRNNLITVFEIDKKLLVGFKQ
jgi:hypothetical protein